MSTPVNHVNNKCVQIIESERNKYAVNIMCPKLIDSINISKLLYDLMTDNCRQDTSNAEYIVVFKLTNDDPSLITRAIQETQILKTTVTRTNKYNGKKTIVDSFWSACEKYPELITEINNHSTPNEAKWLLASKYKYCIVNNFMPGYARAIYLYYLTPYIPYIPSIPSISSISLSVDKVPADEPLVILDQSVGWTDRLLGALSCINKIKNGIRYVGFDPNKSLRSGCVDVMKLFGQELTEITDSYMEFTGTTGNKHSIHSEPFEQGILEYPENYFDFAFTSPPYGTLEIYSPMNPVYKNWIEDFYKPLLIQTCRVLKPHKFCLLHLDDSSSCNVSDLLIAVNTFCDLKLVGKIGLLGMMSNKIRTVWVFQKIITE